MKVEELEKYRESDGCINFDRIFSEVGSEVFSPKKEVRGTENKDKLWIHLDDETFLLKTTEKNTNLEGTCYAEMITAELAKQAEFECANIDLIKYNGFMGVISSKVNKEGEQLHSLREYIGDENIPDDLFPDITGLDYTFEHLKDYLSNTEMSKAEKYMVFQSLMKLMIFDTFVISTDRHPENISFIERMVNGKKEIVLSPLYDNEFSLMLETEPNLLQDLMSNNTVFNQIVTAQEPKIAYKPDSYEELDGNPLYISLLDDLSDMDKDNEPYMEKLAKTLNIDDAIKNVEKKIGVAIPKIYKDTACKAFNERKRCIIRDMVLGLDEEIEKFSENSKDSEEYEIW